MTLSWSVTAGDVLSINQGIGAVMPYDWDASFGPNFNRGWDVVHNAMSSTGRYFGRVKVTLP